MWKCAHKNSIKPYAVMAALLLIAISGCDMSSDEGDGDEYESMEFETSSNLPGGAIMDDVSCGGESHELTVAEWVQRYDGLVFGTIAEIELADDIGWMLAATEEIHGLDSLDRIVDASECEKIVGAMRVRLTDVGGYLHDHDVPTEIDLYFGAARGPMFGDDGPRVDENGIEWPNSDRRFKEGMVIGSPVNYQPVIERWSPLPGSGGTVLFEIDPDNGLRFQELAKLMEPCGGAAPFPQMTGWSADGLQRALDELDANSELYVDVDGRLAISQADVDDEIRLPTEWLGNCVTEDFLDDMEDQQAPTECESSDDCDVEEREVCQDGECVVIDSENWPPGD